MTRFIANDIPGLRLEMERELDRAQFPKSPKGVFACATADLPPAADYTGCMVRDTTTNTFKYSNGVTWS